MFKRNFLPMLAPDDGGGDGAQISISATEAGEVVAIDAEGVNQGGTGVEEGNSNLESLNAEIARLKAESAKQKAALDKATKEAGDARKALKAKMTQEEIDAASKQEAEEKVAKELEELRRKVAKGDAVKSVMGKLSMDEETAGNLADALYGAADIENVLLLIQKGWQAKEAALRKEFGKVTGPGAGSDSNSPEAQAIRRAQELGKSRNAVNEQAQKALNAYIR